MELLKRKDAFLAAWKHDLKRKPFIVKGARQIGKTRSIREIAQAIYEFGGHDSYSGFAAFLNPLF